MPAWHKHNGITLDNCSCESTHASLSLTRSYARQGPEHTLLLLRVSMLPGKGLHANGAACTTIATATAGRHFTGQLPSASWGEHPGTPESAQRGVQCCRTNPAEQAQHGTARQCAAQHSTTQQTRSGHRQDTATAPMNTTRQHEAEVDPAAWGLLVMLPAAGVGCDHRPYCFWILGSASMNTSVKTT